MSHRPNDEPIALYRLYGADDVLLYLGITWNVKFRLEEHKNKKSWFHLVRRHTVEWHPNRAVALVEEAVATAREKPRHDSSWRRRQSDKRPWKDRKGAQRLRLGLITELENGAYAPGTVLGTGETAERYGVARATASIEMGELHRHGYFECVTHGRFRVLAPGDRPAQKYLGRR